MSVFQPLINEIQQNTKTTLRTAGGAGMKLQQEHGYNPMGGCLPMLLTFLVLFISWALCITLSITSSA